MCKFISYRDNQTGEVVYLNVTSVSEARYDEKQNRLELVVGNPEGKCESRYLTDKEAQQAKVILDGFSK